MLDESLLETPEALVRADTRDLLRGTAEAGARVRGGIRRAAGAGVTELRPEGRPRAVLVAGLHPAADTLAGLLSALTGGATPVTAIRPAGNHAGPDTWRLPLPGWAGPVDLLLIATPDGTEPGLAALAEQAYRRGCTVVAVTPPDSPLGTLVTETRGLTVPPAPDPYAPVAGSGAAGPGAPHTAGETLRLPGVAEPPPSARPGALWALLAPLLLLCDRTGLLTAGESAVQDLADRLDTTAERCGPAVAVDDNPAKSLALELSGAIPLLWSEGAVAGAAARHAATTLTSLAGLPALAAPLPEALVLHDALLATASAADTGDDLFRDRVEDPGPRKPRPVLLTDHTVPAPEQAEDAARALARAHGADVRALAPDAHSSPLQAAAELIATADFAAVYLVLATGDA